MEDINKIIDRNTLVLNRKRALTFKNSYNKIHQLAIKEIKDRLDEINRKFKDIAIITGHPEIWGEAFPNAHFIEDTDTLIFEHKRYNLIIHALCLHWSNDPVGQLIQCKNMLWLAMYESEAIASAHPQPCRTIFQSKFRPIARAAYWH